MYSNSEQLPERMIPGDRDQRVIVLSYCWKYHTSNQDRSFLFQSISRKQKAKEKSHWGKIGCLSAAIKVLKIHVSSMQSGVMCNLLL
eukprot:CAMPEP_0176147110 /NCGR_PEP_ID=MMETSP0120_2-20121206/74984_1 /TAXON_ID=160619 /ORGANISM="Kryptoperidinium foliaceum, Strain CCMP 1326" /LENGTH=86 /DNA_ID=CAMNT_0017483701 /DNA_START=74 /DNA_END=331 /DNA_ORIENTATION=+